MKKYILFILFKPQVNHHCSMKAILNHYLSNYGLSSAAGMLLCKCIAYSFSCEITLMAFSLFLIGRLCWYFALVNFSG